MAKATLAPVPKEKIIKKGEQSDYKFEKERIADSRLIRGTFQDNEIKGGTIDFHFKKYKGDPIVRYKLTDGCEYELPLGVVKHLNSGCYYQEDMYAQNGLLDSQGRPLKNANPKKKHRFVFKTAEYS